METIAEPVLSEEIVVDRSPELMRGLSKPRGPSAPLWWLEMMGLRFKMRVTQEIIDQATRGDGATCAFALAWKASRPGDQPHFEGEDPSVTLADGTEIPFMFPTYLVEWIGKFDRGEHVEPFDISFGY